MGDKPPKYDPNMVIFQMRAQWKKAEVCKQQWAERWSWLIDERNRALAESNAIRQETQDTVPQIKTSLKTSKSLKPVPVTSNGVIGWLASKPDCQLEIYTSWLDKPPVRLPDAWENPNYEGKPKWCTVLY